MKFYRCREVKIPSRAHSNDAGIDVYIPEYTKEYAKVLMEQRINCFINIDSNNETIIIPSGKRILIPGGIKTLGREGYALIAFNKSGIATKSGLIMGACVIDESYVGEIMYNLINTSDYDVVINFGQKITQLVIVPMFYDSVKEISEDEFLEKSNTVRGDGGFGSTGV